jgi:hypothetical protein
MRIIAIVLAIHFFTCLPDTNYECISLGENCTIAAALQEFGLRKAAYPFDWLISTYKSLHNVLEHDFENFLDPSCISVHSDNRAIINTYGLIFTHDFPIIFYPRDLGDANPASKDVVHPDWINTLPEVQKKYTRRIERLRDVCMSDKKIYFIRYGGISREEACVLRSLLKEKYTTLDFILVIIGRDPSFAKPWKEKNIKNYYLQTPSTWNDVAQWKKIFINLGLEIQQNKNNLSRNNAPKRMFTCPYHYLENRE